MAYYVPSGRSFRSMPPEFSSPDGGSFTFVPGDHSSSSTRQDKKVLKKLLKDLSNNQELLSKREKELREFKANPPQKGFLAKTSIILPEIVSLVDLGSPLVNLGLNTAWKTTRLIGSLIPTLACVYAIGEAGATAIRIAEIAVGGANIGVKVLGGLGLAALTAKGIHFATLQGKKTYLKPLDIAKTWLTPTPPEEAPEEVAPKPPVKKVVMRAPPPKAQPHSDELSPELLRQLFGGR